MFNGSRKILTRALLVGLIATIAVFVFLLVHPRAYSHYNDNVCPQCGTFFGKPVTVKDYNPARYAGAAILLLLAANIALRVTDKSRSASSKR